MKKVLTIILDGFGMKEGINGNTIINAGMKNFIELWNHYPHSLLEASGESVGLLAEQSGYSEHSHLVISTGQKEKGDSEIINDFFEKRQFKTSKNFNELISRAKSDINMNIHLFCVLSNTGVVSSTRDLINLIGILKKYDIKNNIYLHLISDGYDTNEICFKNEFFKVKEMIKNNVKLSSLSGRKYVFNDIDKSNNIMKYEKFLFSNDGIKMNDLLQVINTCYKKEVYDYDIPMVKFNDYESLKEDDCCVILNYGRRNQADLAKMLKRNNLNVYSFFKLDESIDGNFIVDDKKKTTLTSYFDEFEINIAKVGEKIKKDSFCLYFDGFDNDLINNNDVYFINKNLSNGNIYEMGALEITKVLAKCMKDDYDFILAHFANPDVMGHLGNYDNAINGLQTIDVCLEKIMEIADDNFYKVILIGSHGNVETMFDKKGKKNVEDTTNLVPFVIRDKKVKLRNGDLTNVAPTILKYMDISIPKNMSESLII